jgi:hypothetical protein
MKKEVKATFTLTDSEVEEALYDFYVRKLKASNINAMFSPKEIKIDLNTFEVSLTITEEEDL